MALDLGKQVGPLPLGAWFAVVGVGVGVALYTRNSTAPTPVATDSETPSLDDVGDGTTGGWVPTYPGGTGADSSGNGVATITDNIEWGRRAVNALINDGYDAAQAQSAITKALASGEAGQLSVSEWALWRVALMKLGSPPEPVYTVEPSSAPGPVDSTNAPPAPAPPPEAPPAPMVNAYVDSGQQARDIAGWLDAIKRGWQPGAAETAAFAAAGQTQTLLTALNDYRIAQTYLANFRRPQGWSGPNADAARQWLAAHGYPTK